MSFVTQIKGVFLAMGFMNLVIIWRDIECLFWLELYCICLLTPVQQQTLKD